MNASGCTNFSTKTTAEIRKKFDDRCCFCLKPHLLEVAHLFHAANLSGQNLVNAAARFGILRSTDYERGQAANGLLLCKSCHGYQTACALLLLPSLPILEYLTVEVKKAVESKEQQFHLWNLLDNIELSPPLVLKPWLNLYEVIPMGFLLSEARECLRDTILTLDLFPTYRQFNPDAKDSPTTPLDRIKDFWRVLPDVPRSNSAETSLDEAIPRIRIVAAGEISVPGAFSQHITGLTATSLLNQDENVLWFLDTPLAPVLALASELPMGSLPLDNDTAAQASQLFELLLALQRIQLSKPSKRRMNLLRSTGEVMKKRRRDDGDTRGQPDSGEGAGKEGPAAGGTGTTGNEGRAPVGNSGCSDNNEAGPTDGGTAIQGQERDTIPHLQLLDEVSILQPQQNVKCWLRSLSGSQHDVPTYDDTGEPSTQSSLTPSIADSGGESVASESEWLFSPRSTTNANVFHLKGIRLEGRVNF